MFGFSYEIRHQIVQWMYKKSCDKLDEFAEQLFEAAHQYDIKDLQIASSNSILDSLSTDKVESESRIENGKLRRYKLAHMHHEDGELKSRIGGFININIEEMKESDTWRAVKEADQGLFIELLENFGRSITIKIEDIGDSDESSPMIIEHLKRQTRDESSNYWKTLWMELEETK